MMCSSLCGFLLCHVLCLPQAAFKPFSTEVLVNFSCRAGVVKMWFTDPEILHLKLRLNRP